MQGGIEGWRYGGIKEGMNGRDAVTHQPCNGCRNAKIPGTDNIQTNSIAPLISIHLQKSTSSYPRTHTHTQKERGRERERERESKVYILNFTEKSDEMDMYRTRHGAQPKGDMLQVFTMPAFAGR